nr:MAG TPA: YlxR-like protein [Bacteriophage sp.]DAN08029.1 MAG TPA: YlxR-like protein [Bacteriophage sp.]
MANAQKNFTALIGNGRGFFVCKRKAEVVEHFGFFHSC